MSAQKRHQEALARYENWVMSECGLEPLLGHGMCAVQISAALDEASMAYLKDLVFNGASAATIAGMNIGKQAVAFYFKDGQLLVRDASSETFEVVSSHSQTLYKWSDITMVLTPAQKKAYETKGVSVLAALGIADRIEDVNKLFYSEV